MRQLVWNRSWHHSQGSFWALLFKVAWASRVETAALAERWMGNRERTGISATLPTPAEAIHACNAIGLPLAASTHLFGAVSDGSLEQRGRYLLRFRWCPDCARQWHHSPLFQEWRRSNCPWHGTGLINGCPTCGSFLDPFSNAVWVCPTCRLRLAPKGGDWPPLFREPITRGTDVVADGYLHTEPALLDGDEFEFRLLQPSHRMWERPDKSYYEHHWLREMASEETCVLLDVLLGVHRECVHEEFQRTLVCNQIIEFKCPVAAAACYLATTTGATTTILSRWPPRGRGVLGKPIIWLTYEATRTAPVWLCRILIRELVRSMFYRALRLFTYVANQGQRSLLWQEPQVELASWNLEELDVAVVVPAVTQSELLKVLETAGKLCPWIQRRTDPQYSM